MSRSRLPSIPTSPEISPVSVLAQSARVFFANFPFLAGVTLAVFVPGKLLLQLGCALFDVPADGILAYVLMDASDLALGALAIPAAIYGLTAGTPVGESIGRARKLWGWMLWNKFKVEITIALWTLLLFVPGLVAMVKLALTDAIVAIEGKREREPLARSRELTSGRRWRVFFVMAPLTVLDLAGSFVVLTALPGVAHSRWMLALADSLMAIVGMWAEVAGLLIYLGMSGAGERPAPKRQRQSRR